MKHLFFIRVNTTAPQLSVYAGQIRLLTEKPELIVIKKTLLEVILIIGNCLYCKIK